MSKALDALNGKYGRGTVRFAVQGGEKAFWQPKRERLSPRYTTRWKDLPRVELD